MPDWSWTEQLLMMLVILMVSEQALTLYNAREIKRALDLAAKRVALTLAESDEVTRAQLAEIRGLVDGRMDLALDKVTRLETALANERGEEPPAPNPLAVSTVPPLEE